MRKLFKQCAEILEDLALMGDDFRQATPEDRAKITNLTNEVIYDFGRRDFNKLISNLLDIQKIQSEIYPEDFHSKYVDFFLDSSMWEWIKDRDSNSYRPSEDDWEGASYIVGDLQEILFGKEMFSESE